MNAAHTRPAPAGRFTVALIVAAGIVSAFQVGKVPVALDALRHELTLNLAAASWLMSAFALIGALGGVASGVLVDRLGARRAALAGLALQALGSALGALSPTATALSATRVLEGLGFLLVVVAAPVLIDAATTPQRKPRAFAAWSMFMPLGMSLVMLGTPLLQALGWRHYWGLTAVLLLVCAMLLARHAPSGGGAGPTRHERLGAELAQLLRHAAPSQLALLFALFAASYFAVFAFLPSVLAHRWQLGASLAGALTALAVAAGAAGNWLAGRWLTRGVRPTALLAAAFGALALCAAAVFSETLPAPVAYALCVLFSGFGGLIPTTLFHLAPAAAPHPALIGATMGWLMQGNNLGLLLGPVTAGAVAAGGDWTSVSWLVAAMSGTGCATAFMMHRALRPSRAATSRGTCP